ncbi:MAG: SDR family oxidoreductase [Bacteroides sp.]|nr:SDR family oxidoreductase [Roseburia sp.]MCM1346756.1 SDR family oxidoreductase [Bacteroides sp.]MCM1421307.1 SDR family oxidoreductase [Bacteroides sp.]
MVDLENHSGTDKPGTSCPVAVVTGGSKGIGGGVTEMLFDRGYSVVFTYCHDDAEAAAMSARCMARAKSGQGIYAVKVDHTCRQDTYKLIEKVKGLTSHVDCLVCNAGITVRKSFTETEDADWDSMMEASVHTHYIMMRELYALIPPGSRIIFTGSEMGVHPHATVLGYGVTKAAVHALARNLVKEFEGTGTTVNTVVPGFVDTPWQKNKPEEIRRNICRKTAIHRFASIDEIVRAFAFCIDNSFLNGAEIRVDGGYCYK